MQHFLTRLALLLLLFAGPLGMVAPRAESALPTTPALPTTYVTDWAHLMPAGLYDFIPLDGMSTADWMDPDFQQKILDAERKIRPELNKVDVILPGYMVPLVYEGMDVFEFLLVPSAGQCIHVPPPPVNQTIFIKLDEPTRMRTYGEPVIVQGRLSTTGAVTEYTDTGYRILADEVIDFSFEELDVRLSALEGVAN